MEITPGRAPFNEDESYSPLRKPKSTAASPTHTGPLSMAGCPAMGISAPQPSIGAGDFLGMLQQQEHQYLQQPQQPRTVSPSKLSPFAREFIPGGSYQQQLQHQHHQQAQTYYSHPQQQYRNMNGYQQRGGGQHQHHQQQQQSQYQQHHLQAQQYQQQINHLSSSVQDRLKINGSSTGNVSHIVGGGSYQMQQAQLPHHQIGHLHQQQQRHIQNRYRSGNNNNRFTKVNNHPRGCGGGQAAAAAAAAASVVDPVGEDENTALDYLRSVIQCLNENPGQFDSIAAPFLTIFENLENSNYVLANAMEEIFQQSIDNPNFRYMGAKLYNLLHMLNLKKDSLFHELLRRKLNYHQQEVADYMRNNQPQKVRETALFLAELYMQLRGDDSRIQLIAENILYSLQQLMSKETPDNIRCICLTLKLAGFDLTSDCPVEMEGIITRLKDINLQNPGKYPLAANVIALQKENWGRKPSLAMNSTSESENGTVANLRTSDEPVFYGPDGRELTAEESDFLCEEEEASGAHHEQGAAAVDLDLDDEMDAEAQKDYMEFCKQNEKL